MLKKASHIISKNFVIYAKRDLVLTTAIKNVRDDCHYTRKYRAAAHNL